MIGVLLLFCKKKKRCAPNASGSNREEKKKGELLYYLDVVLSSSSLPSLLPVLCARLLLQKKPLCLSLSLSSIRDFHFTRAPAPFGRRRDNLKCCGEDRENKMG